MAGWLEMSHAQIQAADPGKVPPPQAAFYLKRAESAQRRYLNAIKTLTEVRRWLSQSSGGIDRGGVFFGSFVSAFVNPKIAPADRVLRIRSQPFYRPKP